MVGEDISRHAQFGKNASQCEHIVADGISGGEGCSHLVNPHGHFEYSEESAIRR